MAKRKIHIGLLIGLVLLTASCTEDIIMDVPEGKKVPVVEGSMNTSVMR